MCLRKLQNAIAYFYICILNVQDGIVNFYIRTLSVQDGIAHLYIYMLNVQDTIVNFYIRTLNVQDGTASLYIYLLNVQDAIANFYNGILKLQDGPSNLGMCLRKNLKRYFFRLMGLPCADTWLRTVCARKWRPGYGGYRGFQAYAVIIAWLFPTHHAPFLTHHKIEFSKRAIFEAHLERR